jgi:Cu2+-exporting ATPase
MSNQAALSLLDERQEWARFGQPAKGSEKNKADDDWVSHVVVQGMHCAACAYTVEKALMSVPGVKSAEVSATTHRAKVVWSASKVLPSQWLSALVDAGYGAVPALDTSLRQIRKKEMRLALWRWLVAGFCMMQLMMYAYPSYIAGDGDITPEMVNLLRWAAWVITLPVLLFSCGPFFANAWRDIRRREISMDLPVAIGMGITFLVSSAATFDPTGVWGSEVYFDSLSMFVFFLLTGRWLELRMRDKTAGALEAVMNRLPDSVERQKADGQFERVSVARLQVDDLIRVNVGEGFAADGVIVQGDTLTDEALLTGESHPQARAKGDAVVAGSFNLSAPVVVRVVKVGEDTQFAQIVDLMQSASIQKPRLAQLADRMAKPFLLGVLVLALGAASWWWPTSPSQALMVAVSVLIVTCPCALSLATPAAMLAASGTLARQGVLVRHLQALEALAEVDTLIFDKTGTLTRDAQRITQSWTAQDASAASVLAWAASLAKHSLHPYSRAMQLAFETSGTVPPETADLVLEFMGQGIEGQVAGQKLRLGSAKFCKLENKEVPHEALSAQVHLCSDTAWLGSWKFAEDIRPDAADTVRLLKHTGIDVWLLSGDQSQAVQLAAKQLQIEHAQGLCTPKDKLQKLQALQAQGARVAMVGDGLNDGPVLSAAHVSLAFGNAVPLAQSKADLVVMGDSLMTVVHSIHMAHRTLKIVKQNLAWAAVYNAVCVPLAVMGWLPAWLAGLGMALSSLGVVLNALRLSFLTKN